MRIETKHTVSTVIRILVTIYIVIVRIIAGFARRANGQNGSAAVIVAGDEKAPARCGLWGWSDD
jgi:hypothetical protein